MCMLSVLTTYGKDTVNPISWTPQTWADFKQTATQVEALDTALGEPDCIDPAKEQWMKEMDARMQALEAAAFRNTAFRGPIPD